MEILCFTILVDIVHFFKLYILLTILNVCINVRYLPFICCLGAAEACCETVAKKTSAKKVHWYVFMTYTLLENSVRSNMCHVKSCFHEPWFIRPHFNQLLLHCRSTPVPDTLVTSHGDQLRWLFWSKCSAQSIEPIQIKETLSKLELRPLGNEKMGQEWILVLG